MNAQNIPIVDPMMVRRFTFSENGHNSHGIIFGGIWVMDDFGVEEIGIASSRMKYDEVTVDCSARMFEITNYFALVSRSGSMCCFTMRRFRDCWIDAEGHVGPTLLNHPSEKPFLFIGNPIRIFFNGNGEVEVYGNSEHIIKSGIQMGF